MLASMAREPERRSSIGKNLARLRERAGLTQAELAEKSGVSLATIAHLESGDRDNPRTSTLAQLALALGVNPTAFHADAEETPAGERMTLEQFLEVERDLSAVDREELSTTRTWSEREGLPLGSWIELRDWLRARRKAAPLPGGAGGTTGGGLPPKK